MLLLIPLGPEDRSLRAPLVTIGLLVVNVVVFLWTVRLDTSGTAATEGELARVAKWTIRLADQQVPGLAQRAGAYDSPLAFLERDTLWRQEIRSADLRERLEACLEDGRRLRSGHPFYAHGFVPAQVSLPRLLAHQFLHADFLHLGFNMLFLWAVGGLLEVTLGAAIMAAAYLTGGIAAALAHAAFHPGSTEPVIGASGAVAGLMGMFALMHGGRPVRLALIAVLALTPRIFFLTWPAYVFLGLWLLEQLFYASFGLSSLGIAFWAHIDGFVFGMVVALALRAVRGPVAPA